MSGVRLMQAIHGLHPAGMLRMSKSAVLPICHPWPPRTCGRYRFVVRIATVGNHDQGSMNAVLPLAIKTLVPEQTSLPDSGE